MDSIVTIGVTGGIGSGKSMICRIVSTLGYPVFYSDSEAKLLYTEDQSVRMQVVELFGDEAYGPHGLNRKFLADSIYQEPELKVKLEEIIHPAVRSKFKNWAAEQSENLVFNEAAILFETGGYKEYDHTILVTSPLELRLERILKRDGLSKEEVEKRLNSQWPDAKKAELASFIISNDEQNLIIPQVLDTLEKIKQA